jgi:hypothetical protein
MFTIIFNLLDTMFMKWYTTAQTLKKALKDYQEPLVPWGEVCENRLSHTF